MAKQFCHLQCETKQIFMKLVKYNITKSENITITFSESSIIPESIHYPYMTSNIFQRFIKYLNFKKMPYRNITF